MSCHSFLSHLFYRALLTEVIKLPKYYKKQANDSFCWRYTSSFLFNLRRMYRRVLYPLAFPLNSILCPYIIWDFLFYFNQTYILDKNIFRKLLVHQSNCKLKVECLCAVYCTYWCSMHRKQKLHSTYNIQKNKQDLCCDFICWNEHCKWKHKTISYHVVTMLLLYVNHFNY